jgi:hypothetical protein
MRENPPVEKSHGATDHRVPHISLVFCEMWDATAADLHSLALQGPPIEVRGIPHLAKNERDVGHPMIRGPGQKLDRRVLTQTLKPLLFQRFQPRPTGPRGGIEWPKSTRLLPSFLLLNPFGESEHQIP